MVPVRAAEGGVMGSRRRVMVGTLICCLLAGAGGASATAKATAKQRAWSYCVDPNLPRQISSAAGPPFPNEWVLKGDWNGDGTDTVGVSGIINDGSLAGSWSYDLRNSNSAGPPDIKPFVGITNASLLGQEAPVVG